MLFFDDRNSYISLQGRLLLYRMVSVPSKRLYSFVIKLLYFHAQENKTLAHVSWVTTRAPIVKTKCFIIKPQFNHPGSLDV